MGPPKETTFPAEFCNEYYTLYSNTKKIILKQKNSQENLSFQNGIISISAKIWKTTFPKEFFYEIWLIIGDHEYISITETKTGNFF